MYTLMLQDTEVLKFDYQKFQFEVCDESKLPLSLRGADIKQDYFTKMNMLRELYDWLSSRMLSLDRACMKEICLAYDLVQSNDVCRRVEIALKYKCLSLMDDYWVRSEYDTCKWKDVSLRENHLSNVLFGVALKGDSPTIQNVTLDSAELHTYGTFPKAWKREADGIYLYKAGIGYEGTTPRIEVNVSKILDSIGIDHLHYDLVEVEETTCSKSKCMASDEYSVVPMITVEQYFARKGKMLYDAVREDERFARDFYQMVQIDYIIANGDRHNRNWGIFMDNKTGEIVRLHPLYDHNCAFAHKTMRDADKKSSTVVGKTMKQLAKEGARKFPIVPESFVNSTVFLAEDQERCFYNRCNELGIEFPKQVKPLSVYETVQKLRLTKA